MVYYFKTRCGQYTIYMGKDKYENEDLIKYGHPEDCVSYWLFYRVTILTQLYFARSNTQVSLIIYIIVTLFSGFTWTI